jgi:hypothetical protein
MKRVAGLSGRPLVVPVRAHQPAHVMGVFLTHEFAFLGIEFQNWMVVAAAMVLLYLIYLWVTDRN